ncbi:MAG: hypothetical protein AMS27_17665 [Bacteroides sp. SM23_62_1]|nr:MAG: hypothetical protein AMS27_17665 [Bacteroides sp. SM23_62_1]
MVFYQIYFRMILYFIPVTWSNPFSCSYESMKLSYDVENFHEIAKHIQIYVTSLIYFQTFKRRSLSILS